MFTKGPKTSAKIQKVIDYKFDPITRENIQNLGPVEKLSKYIDNYVTDLRETYAGELYKVILKSEPNLSPQQFLNRINSGTGSYARYRGVIFNQIIQDLAEKFGCKIEESTFGRAFHRTNIKWDENTGAIADIDLAYLSPNAVRRSESAFEALETRKKPRALINVGYAPSPSRGAGRGTGISSAITELMQASVIGKNYMQQSPDPTTGKISYDIAKPAKSPDSRSAAREIQNVMTSTIDLTQPLTRYDTAPKFAKSRKPTKHSTAPKQQQTEISPSIYPTRTAPASRRQAPYSYDQIRPHPSSPRIVVNYSYSDPRRERDLSYVFGNYNYDYPNRSYKFDPYSYNYDFPPNKTSIPEIPTFITGGDNPFWRRHKDESVQQDRQNLKKYHKYTEITGGATAGQAMNFIWGNSTAFYQKMLRTQGAGEEGKLTVDKKSTQKSSAKNSKSSLHPILFESLI
jgi:hypothetical protein